MRKIILACIMCSFMSQAHACLDCGDTGTDAVFSGTVTATVFAGPTITSLQQLAVRTNSVVVGTSAARGAQIVSTTTAGFDFAISTLGNGGTVYVQKGDYFQLHGVTVPANVTFVFEDSAVIKNDQTIPLETVFFVSGTIMDCNVNISTGLYQEVPPTFFMERGGRVIRPRVQMRWDTFAPTYSPSGLGLHRGIFYFGSRSNNAVVDSPIISSFTVINTAGTDSDRNIFVIAGSSGGSILNPIVLAQRPQALNSQAPVILLTGCDGFIIRGGFIHTSERAFWGNPTADEVVRGFDWSGTYINSNVDPQADGLLDFDGTSVNWSSGNIVNGLHINHTGTKTSATFGAAAAVDRPNRGLIWANNVIQCPAGTTVAAFQIPFGVATFTALMGNVVFNTTTFIADTGSNTKYTNNDNFLNGVEQ